MVVAFKSITIAGSIYIRIEKYRKSFEPNSEFYIRSKDFTYYRISKVQIDAGRSIKYDRFDKIDSNEIDLGSYVN